MTNTNAFDGTGYIEIAVNSLFTRTYEFYVPGPPQEEYEKDFEEWSNYWGE